jgi:alpha-soluble NSF attachment protein
MDDEERADALVEKTEKKLNSFSLFSSQSSRLEEAEENFFKATSLYKVAKKYAKAGETFRKLANVRVKLDNKFEAATAYNDAANAFKNVSIPDAIKCLQDSSALYVDIGKFSNAARAQKEMGEHYESEGDKENAIKAFETAASYHGGEGAASHENACRLKAAHLYALLEKYPQAIEIFETVGMACAENTLAKYTAKEHFFKAGLCHFCVGDTSVIERALQKYCDWDPSFSTQRENKLLVAILEAFKSLEVDEFTAAVAEFDSISKLDSWKTTILLRIKEAIKAAQNEIQ